MRFAHLKTHHRFERMRLRGFSGAREDHSAGELVPLPAFNRAPPATRVAGLHQTIVLPLAFETAPHPLSSVGLEAAILWRVGPHEDA